MPKNTRTTPKANRRTDKALASSLLEKWRTEADIRRLISTELKNGNGTGNLIAMMERVASSLDCCADELEAQHINAISRNDNLPDQT